jgi:RND family efflux transporter MFP subunit|tara:strand:+ start:380 stop:1549 length:1170 start_codon:yes stop_codon:yes gene_type:complete
MIMKRTLMIALCTLILGACSEEKTVQKLVKPVSTMIIGETKTYESRVVSGVVQPSDTTQLSFEVTGKVQEVYFELGEGFEKGQPLAKLDQINYELAVKEREGQLSEAKARLLESRRDFERKSDLVKDGAVSKSQFDISKSQFETAKDQVDIAKARLGMAKEDLDDTTLKAPYKGTVAARMIEPSQRVSPNMAAFTVQGDNGLEVSVLVPESLLSSISIGKVASIEIPAVNMDFNAVIKEIGTAAEDASSFPVTLKINSEDTQKLKPGMSAEVTLEFDRVQEFAEGFKLPVNALLAESENRHFVFKLTKPETISQNNANGQEAIAPEQTQNPDEFILTKAPVEIIQLFDQHAVVGGDLKEGEIIVDAGLPFLSDGLKVTPISKGVNRYNP